MVKFREFFCWEGGVTKKRHGHNIEFWALKLNEHGTNQVGPMLIQKSPTLNIVAICLFCGKLLRKIIFLVFHFYQERCSEINKNDTRPAYYILFFTLHSYYDAIFSQPHCAAESSIVGYR